MKNHVLRAEVSFWAIWFALPYLFSFAGTGGGNSLTLFLVFSFGLLLSGITFFLRDRAKLRFITNTALSILFFFVYSMIGYPSLIRPNGETFGLGLVLLLLVGLFPLSFFLCLRVASRNLK